MRFLTGIGSLAAFLCFVTASASALGLGVPVDGQLGMQAAQTPVMEKIVEFHNQLLIIITVISLLVLGLLVWVMVRYNERANPEPSKFSHNTLVEIVWTGIPILILIVIAVPSFRLLYFQDTIPEADFTIKTTGNQWNWTYIYTDHGGFEFVSSMLPDDEIASHPFKAYRNLSTDVPIVVPAGATVRVEVTASDVIHNWAMPAFGIKMDAIPGRMNETWFQVDQVGVYYGQCSELCGRLHSYMPIEVHVVPTEVFDAWVDAANEDPYEAASVLVAYYDENNGGTRLASAQ